MNFLAFAFAGLLLIDTSAINPAAFVGTYRGSLWSGDGDLPSITTLKIGADLVLSGEYSFIEQTGQTTSGSLDACQIEMRVLICEWHDRYGTGVLKMEFDPSLCAFQGQWTTANLVSTGWSYWNGSKGCTPVANAGGSLLQGS